jgi:hypothetical protein
MHKELVFLFTVVLVASGQLAQVPEQRPPTEPNAAAEAKRDLPGMVYVYRVKVRGNPLKPSVYCDGQEVARLDDGRYFVIKLEPGRHSFRSTDEHSGGDLIVKPGETYYLRVKLIPHFPVARGRLHAVLPEMAAYELKELEYLGADKIRSTRVLLGDPGARK